MPKRFLILANPIAGGGRARQRAPELAKALQQLGCEAEVCFSTQRGDLGRRAADVLPGSVDGIVSVGGDGTLNEILNGLPEPNVPICPMGMGTANVLSLVLATPKRPAELASLLCHGGTVPAAVGLWAVGKEPPRRFLLFASAGIDANIVERFEAVRRGTGGKLKWTGPVLHTIRRWPIRTVTVHVRASAGVGDGDGDGGGGGDGHGDRDGDKAGGREYTNVTSICVTRVETYGGMLHLPGSIQITDGRLHVLLFRQRSRWSYFKAVLRGLTSRLRVGRDCECFSIDSSNEIEISGDGVPFQIDGDLAGHLQPERPLRIWLHPEPARLFADPAMIRG